MGRQRVLAQGEATPSAWRAKVTALKDDDFVPSSKKEKKERKYMYHIMLGFHGYEWGVELSFKALFELNQAIAEDIPGYLSVAFPPKRLLKRKGKTKQGEKRRGLLEQWVTELLTATEVSALSPVVDLLEIPNDVMGWVSRPLSSPFFSSFDRVFVLLALPRSHHRWSRAAVDGGIRTGPNPGVALTQPTHAHARAWGR
eukprot:m.320259 g.320259  ORF g.320259 m.320259 type:complete len:199 (-) comp16450_c0_seq11:2595-3191(-)